MFAFQPSFHFYIIVLKLLFVFHPKVSRKSGVRHPQFRNDLANANVELVYILFRNKQIMCYVSMDGNRHEPFLLTLRQWRAFSSAGRGRGTVLYLIGSDTKRSEGANSPPSLITDHFQYDDCPPSYNSNCHQASHSDRLGYEGYCCFSCASSQ